MFSCLSFSINSKNCPVFFVPLIRTSIELLFDFVNMIFEHLFVYLEILSFQKREVSIVKTNHIPQKSITKACSQQEP